MYNQLPVSATSPNTNNFIQGLPNNVPFRPPVDIGAQAQHLILPVTGQLLLTMQSEAGKNPLRTFMFNFLSRDGYQNPDFAEVLASTVEYAEMLAFRTRNPQQAVEQAVTDMATLMASVYAKKFPELLKMAPNSAQVVEQNLHRFNILREEIDMFYKEQQQYGARGQQPQQPPQQNWGQQPQQPQWNQPPPQQQWNQPPQQVQSQNWNGGQPQPWGQPQQPPQRGQQWGGQPAPQQNWNQPPPQQNWNQPPPQQNWGQPQQPQWGGQQPQGQWNQNRNPAAMGIKPNNDFFQQPNQQQGAGYTPPGGRQLRGSLKPKMAAAGFTQQPQYDQPPVHQSPQQNWGKNPTVDTGFMQDSNISTNLNAWVPEENVSVEENVVTTEERPYDHLMTSELEAKPIHLTDWVFTPTEECPYRLAYDPSKQVKFMALRRDGTVTELVEDFGENNMGMEYLANELPSKVRSRLPKTEGKGRVVANWDAIGVSGTIDEVVELMEADDVVPEMTVVIDGIQTGYSAEHIKALKNSIVLDGGLVPNDGSPTEYVSELITPFVFKDMSIDATGVEAEYIRTSMYALSKYDDLGDFIERINVLNKVEGFPKDILTHVVERGTEAINSALKNGMGYSWTLDSLLTDWAELRDYFIEKFGTEQGSALYTKFKNAKERWIIKYAAGVLRDEAVNKLVKNTNVVNEKNEENFSKGVLFSEISSVTEVSWSINDISLELDDGSGAVLESKLPELYKAITEILDRSSKRHFGTLRNFIETSDGVRFEIHRGILGAGYLILSTT